MRWFMRVQNADAGGSGGGASGAGTAADGAAGAGGASGAAAAASGSGVSGGGGSLAAAARQAAQGGDAKPAAPADGQQPAAGGDAPYWPQGLDQGLRGANERETLDRIAAHMQGLPRPPEKPDGYQFEPGKELAPFIDPKNDPVLPIFRDIAHKQGLSQQQFEGTINQLYGAMIEKGLLEAPVDVQGEIRKLGGQGDPATTMRKGAERLAALEQQITGLATRGEITKEQAAVLVEAYGTADAAIAFERLLSLIPSAKGPQNGGQATAPAAATIKDVEARMLDPRYDPLSRQFDAKFREETIRLFEQVA